MAFISAFDGWLVLAVFGLAMLLITWFFTRHERLSTEDFLMAGRNVPWWMGAASIAASWIWAPALFLSSQMAYQLGLPGIFWFTAPNIVAVAIFILLAPKIRAQFQQGHTFAEFIGQKLGDQRLRKVYFFGQSFYQLMAVSVQLFAGGNLVQLLTGIPLLPAMLALAAIVLAYSWLSGLRSSIVTDVVQLAVIFVGIAIVVPSALSAGGGFEAVWAGLGGVTGKHSDLFDPGVAFSFGLVTSIGLIAGSLSDQQFWQRVFAFEKKSVVPGFMGGALLFGIVPIALSVLGFLAAAPGSGIALPEGTDASLIGVLAVAHLLPSGFLLAFLLMLLAGLASTMDSALNAFSSLYAVDAKKYVVSHDLRHPKVGMLLILAAGFLVALAAAWLPGFGLKQLFWIFGAVASSMIVPTILSLYWDKLTAKGALWGVGCSLLFGLPAFVYGNLVDSPVLIVGAALFIVTANLACCLFFSRARTPA